ncbi:unnamed protein product [Schistosoma margrebowiei]|uniref:Uncharacterized protein n=1 Tax=Schistosoma margrebowiei TaxID=48269 RepID=A0A183MW78_9TREM|nr:unnamed protein product [Schistosoma margrebowiei]
MKTFISDEIHGIKWTSWMQLDDLDFTDEIAILTHTYQQLQIRIKSVTEASALVGLNIYKRKSNILKFKTEYTNPITFDGESLEEVESFTYLDRLIDEQGGSDADVKKRIGEARTAFLQFKDICNSKQLSTSINVTIFNMNIKTPLLYGAETSKTTVAIIKKVQVFFHVRYSIYVDRILSALVHYGRGKTTFHVKGKLGKEVGSRQDIYCENHQTAS